MPLTIKPLKAIDALSLNVSLMSKEYGTIRTWIGTASPMVDDLGRPILYTTKGSTVTKRATGIPGQHHCDNLQLDGNLEDWMFLEHYKVDYVVSPYGFGFSQYSVLVDGYIDRWAPCMAIVNWSSLHYITFTRASNNKPFAWVTITGSRDTWTQFNYGIDGAVAPFGSSISVILVKTQKIDATHTKMWQLTRNYSVSGHTASLDTLVTFLYPSIQATLDTDWWKNVTPVTSSGVYWFATNSSFVPSEAWASYYKKTKPEWLSALKTVSGFDVDYGELHYGAVSKIDITDLNGLQFIKDIKGFLKELKKLWDLAHGEATIKGLADAYLSYKYGPASTARDTTRLLKAVSTAKKKSGVSSTDTQSVAHGILKTMTTIRYSPFDTVMEDLYNFFRQLDLLPSVENIWELLPYSFVLDWFFHIDEIYKRVDELDHLNHLKISCVFDTYIFDGTYPAANLFFTVNGMIVIHRYRRHCGRDASFPLVVPNSSLPISHWLEGLALIVQRLAR